jgi:hypothetical protein
MAPYHCRRNVANFASSTNFDRVGEVGLGNIREIQSFVRSALNIYFKASAVIHSVSKPTRVQPYNWGIFEHILSLHSQTFYRPSEIIVRFKNQVSFFKFKSQSLERSNPK